MNRLLRKSRCGRSERPNGFTLMELLIVISIILILMLLAIPTVTSMKITGNETSAKYSLQAINKAQVMFQTNYGASGYACTLAALGGDPKQGNPSAASAQILPADLTTGTKDGYIFSIVNCKKAPNSDTQVISYDVTAVPQVVGKTGSRGFCLDMAGTITTDPTGGANCAAQTTTAPTPAAK